MVLKRFYLHELIGLLFMLVSFLWNILFQGIIMLLYLVNMTLGDLLLDYSYLDILGVPNYINLFTYQEV